MVVPYIIFFFFFFKEIQLILIHERSRIKLLQYRASPEVSVN
jgi:hypothetical protein